MSDSDYTSYPEPMNPTHRGDPRSEAIAYAYEPHVAPAVKAIVLMVSISAGTGDGQVLSISNALVSRIADAQGEWNALSGEARDNGVRKIIHAHIEEACGIPIAWETPPDIHHSFQRPKRKAIPNRLRMAILQRDRHTCRWCGDRNPINLTIDHIIPVSRGGGNDPDNLQVLCRSCNSSKGAR